MTKEQAIEKFINFPSYRDRGSGELSKIWHLDIKDVKEARETAKWILKNKDVSSREREIKRQAVMPKILILDTETAPLEAYVFGLWKQNIAWDHTIAQWFMLCWSAKWLFSNEILTDCVTGEEALKEDDSRIMTTLWELIDKADIVVAHNAKGADIPWLNTRFILNGLTPPKPYFIIDTLDIARRQFAFSSNKLDALAGYFGIEHKMDTDFNLWKRCKHGDDKALAYMQEYNMKDVDILEEIFLKIRPWIKNYPNANNFINSNIPICATCGSENIEELKGQYYYTSVGKYSLYRCRDCGAITRGRYNLRLPRNIKAVGVGK